MVFSMTAFARGQDSSELGQFCWEIRSVNHRFLDIHMKIPDIFRDMEMQWRNTIKKTLKRGKVECSLSFVAEKISPSLRLNPVVVSSLLQCCSALQNETGVDHTLKAIDVLKWPQAVAQDPIDIGPIEKDITQALANTLDKLVQNRANEGEALKQILLSKLDEMTQLHQKAVQIAPLRIQLVQEKLEKKLSEFAERLDRDRLEQEVVLYAQKLDVDEELDRLQTHLVEARKHLMGNEGSGKHLDFLMQEFNREANTLASKSNHAELTQVALGLKVLIEQMREQIQNVE